MTSNLLSVEKISKAYGSTRVLRGLSLDLAAGEKVAVIGRSGSGKSTLLRCVNGLEPVDEGSVKFDGELVHPRSPRIREVRRQIGFVFQSFNLFPHMTALENVAIGLRKVRKLAKGEAREKAASALRQVGLIDKINSWPRELSGGQQQRVGIARAIAMEPRMIVFDEPTSALDPELVGEVLAVIRDLAEGEMSMLLVTHEMRFARRVADRVVFVSDGAVVAGGTPESMFGVDGPPEVRNFVREAEHEF